MFKVNFYFEKQKMFKTLKNCRNIFHKDNLNIFEDDERLFDRYYPFSFYITMSFFNFFFIFNVIILSCSILFYGFKSLFLFFPIFIFSSYLWFFLPNFFYNNYLKNKFEFSLYRSFLFIENTNVLGQIFENNKFSFRKIDSSFDKKYIISDEKSKKMFETILNKNNDLLLFQKYISCRNKKIKACTEYFIILDKIQDVVLEDLAFYKKAFNDKTEIGDFYSKMINSLEEKSMNVKKCKAQEDDIEAFISNKYYDSIEKPLSFNEI